MEEELSGKLLTALQSISDRMARVETQLQEVVRLEERVSNHAEVLSRYGRRIDSQEERIRHTELWQANFGERSIIEQEMAGVKGELKEFSKKLQAMESSRSLSKGQKDVVSMIFKWTMGIMAAVIIYSITEKEASACPLTYPHLEQDFQSSVISRNIPMQ